MSYVRMFLGDLWSFLTLPYRLVVRAFHEVRKPPSGTWGPDMIDVDAAERDVLLLDRVSGFGRVGHALTYQVAFAPGTDSLPRTYEFQNLPPGLTGDTATGIISGTPTQAGTFGVMIGASDSFSIQKCGVVFVIEAT